MPGPPPPPPKDPSGLAMGLGGLRKGQTPSSSRGNWGSWSLPHGFWGGGGCPMGGCCPMARGFRVCAKESGPHLPDVWKGQGKVGTRGPATRGGLWWGLGDYRGAGGGSSPPRAVSAFTIPRGTHCPGAGGSHGCPHCLRPQGLGGEQGGSPIPPQLKPCPGVTPSHPTAPFPNAMGPLRSGGGHTVLSLLAFPRVGDNQGGDRQAQCRGGGPSSPSRPGSSGTGAGAGLVSRSLPERWEQLRWPSACRNPAGMPPGRICPCLGRRQLLGMVSPQRAQRPR